MFQLGIFCPCAHEESGKVQEDRAQTCVLSLTSFKSKQKWNREKTHA